jgi:Guanylate kinase
MKDKLIASERMKEFYKDIKHWTDYDYVVINDNLKKCYKEISGIINKIIFKKKKISFNKKKIEKHVTKLVS